MVLVLVSANPMAEAVEPQPTQGGIFWAATFEAMAAGMERCKHFDTVSLEEQMNRLTKKYGNELKGAKIINREDGLRVFVANRYDKSTGENVVYAYFDSINACEEFQTKVLQEAHPTNQINNKTEPTSQIEEQPQVSSNESQEAMASTTHENNTNPTYYEEYPTRDKQITLDMSKWTPLHTYGETTVYKARGLYSFNGETSVETLSVNDDTKSTLCHTGKLILNAYKINCSEKTAKLVDMGCFNEDKVLFKIIRYDNEHSFKYEGNDNLEDAAIVSCTKQEQSKESSKSWYVMPSYSGTNECIPSMSPAEWIKEVRSPGHDPVIKEERDSIGLLSVEVTHFENDTMFSKTIYRDKSSCDSALSQKMHIPNEYR